MSIIVNKNEFRKALEITQRALPAIFVQEERGHILARTKGNKLILSATNTDLKALCTIPLVEPIDQDFSFTVEPKSVKKLLTKTKIENIKIEPDNEKCIARYITSEDEKSFAEAQSFSEDIMLTFEDSSKDVMRTVSLKRSTLVAGLEYANSYLEDIKVDKQRYDFVILNRGLIYSANGSNKMGFLVSKDFKDFEDFKIRKVFVPVILKVLESTKGEDDVQITLFESAKNLGIYNEDKSIVISCLRSDIAVPEVKRDNANTNGPYTIVNRKRILESIDRLSSLDKTAKSFGIRVVLTGSGEDAALGMSLVTSLKSKEVFPCERVQDNETGEVEHIIDNRLLRSILSSFTGESIRMYINEESKMFKVYEKGDINGSDYHAFAIGAYSKVLRN